MGHVLVAPREITDLVNRACRVAGCGASVAAEVAQDVTACEVHRGTGIAAFLDLVDAEPCELRELAVQAASDRSGPAVLSFRQMARHERPDERDREALTNGVAIDATVWSRLETIAADFLLAEHVIDGSS